MTNREPPWHHPPWNGDLRRYIRETNHDDSDTYRWVDIFDGLGMPSFVDSTGQRLSVAPVPAGRSHRRHQYWVDVDDPVRRAVAPKHTKEQRALLAGMLAYWDERLPNGRPSQEMVNSILLVLSYHRPDFDDLPIADKDALIRRVWQHVAQYLSGLDRMLECLATGMSGNELRRAIAGVNADVKAALAKDVDDMTELRIGHVLSTPPPPSDAGKNSNSTVRGMVRRGRDHLQRALGPRGAQKLLAELRELKNTSRVGRRRNL